MKVLLLIDIQNDYFPAGAMELVGAVEAAKKAKILLDTFRKQNLPIIHMQHISIRPDATFFLPGTTGAEIHPSVAPIPTEIVLQKHFPNSFRDTGLQDVLTRLNVTELVIAGMMTQMCVDTTTRAAFDLGYESQLAADACATRDLSFAGRTTRAEDVQISYMAALDGSFTSVQTANEIVSGLEA
jgi:nicotinamidase-related amidase